MRSDPQITEISLAPSKSLSLRKFERTENMTFICSIGKVSQKPMYEEYEEFTFVYTNR